MRSTSSVPRNLSAALVVLLCLAGCVPGEQSAAQSTEVDPAPQFSSGSTSLSVEGGTVEHGGVRVSVPVEATPDGSELKVEIGDEIGQVENEYATELFSEPVQVDHTVDLSKPLTITWDISDLEEPQKHLSLVRWDEELRVWQPSEEIVTVADGVASVQVQEFSTVAWTSILAQKVGELTGKRIDEPECTGDVLPDWVDNTVDPDENEPNAAVRVCFEPDSRDSIVTVRVGNNRSFAQVMQLDDAADDFAWRWNGDEKYDITAVVYNAAHAVLDDGDTMVLPPLSTQAVGIGRPTAPGSSMVMGSSSVGWQSILADVLALSFDSLSIGGTNNPALDALIQVLFECGGKQLVLATPRTTAEQTRAVVDTIGGCADEALRPDSEFGARFESLSRQMIAKASASQAAAIQLNRAARSVASAFKILKFADVAFYASDQFANSVVGPLAWSVSGRGATKPLGTWTPTCTDTSADSDKLYRNLALQDEFTETSKELWQFENWASAANTAVAPLSSCAPSHLTTLALMLPTAWADERAASIVASAILTLKASACQGLYGPEMTTQMEVLGLQLNVPPDGVPMSTFEGIGVRDDGLRAILDAHGDDLQCRWFSDGVHNGIGTQISELTPDEMATVQGIFSSPQFESEQFLEGTRYYFTEIIPAEQAAYGVDTELGESYFVRGLTLVATKWTGEAPNGYTREVIENLK